MTPEERDELRRDLEAAGCSTLAMSVAEDSGLLSSGEESELRSLLRREVWVVQVVLHGASHEGTFSSVTLANEFVKQFTPALCEVPLDQKCGFWIRKHTIDAEVPDADG